MPFGNGKTAYKKAGFPDVGFLTLFDFPNIPIEVAKLGAGRSREVYHVINASSYHFIGGDNVVVKMEVQCPPDVNDCAVGEYGGRNDWRTNEHELKTIKEDPNSKFSPEVIEPGLTYGHITNCWGKLTPVCILFMRCLENPDLQDAVDLAACIQDDTMINYLCRGGVRAILEAARVNICGGDMRLDNVGMTANKEVIICDLGGSKPASCKNVKASICTFLKSMADALAKHGGVLHFDVHSDWTQESTPSEEKIRYFDLLCCSFTSSNAPVTTWSSIQGGWEATMPKTPDTWSFIQGTPPPPPCYTWEEHIYTDTKTGVKRPYYFDIVNSHSQWNFPTGECVRKVTTTAASVGFSASSTSSFLNITMAAPDGEMWCLACGRMMDESHKKSRKHESRSLWWEKANEAEKEAWAAYTREKLM